MVDSLSTIITQIFSYNTLELFLIFVAIIVLGYFIGKLVAFLLKIVLNKILGLDNWLHEKGILINKSLTSIIINIVKFFIYFYFIGYAFYIIPYTSFIGTTIFNILNYLLAIILLMIISYAMMEILIKSSIEQVLENNKYKDYLLYFLKFIIMFFVLVLILSYLNLLSPVLLYLFVILFAGIVISISVAIGIALADIIKKKIREIIK
ncbi:hypothetical protein YN1_0440 [Nanoarchaeota archaeon]